MLTTICSAAANFKRALIIQTYSARFDRLTSSGNLRTQRRHTHKRAPVSQVKLIKSQADGRNALLSFSHRLSNKCERQTTYQSDGRKPMSMRARTHSSSNCSSETRLSPFSSLSSQPPLYLHAHTSSSMNFNRQTRIESIAGVFICIVILVVEVVINGLSAPSRLFDQSNN